MRQVWIPRTGGPEVLEVREAPDPEPGEGQVRIRVAAAGLNFADTVARKGTRNPVHILKALLAMPSFKPFALMDKNRGVFGVNLGHLWSETDRLRTIMDDIMALVREKQLDPIVDRAFRFSEAADAHRFIQERRNFGKVLLVP